MNLVSARFGLALLIIVLAANRADAEPSLRLKAGATTQTADDFNGAAGFAFGGSLALARWAPSEHFALVPHLELLLTRRNATLAAAGVESWVLTIDSLELPVVVRGEVTLGGRAFYVLAGGYGGLRLRTRQMDQDGIVDRTDAATTADLGLLAGAGFELSSFSWGELFVEMRYQRSYRPLLDNGESKPDLFSVLLGYGLGSNSMQSPTSWTRARSLALKGGFVATGMAGATDSEYSSGVSFGAAFSPARIGSRFALVPQLEVLYVHRSAENPSSGIDSLVLDSMDSSALVRAELTLGRKSVFGIGGAYASVTIGAERIQDGAMTDARDGLPTLDVGWVAGAGVEITAATQTRLALEIRYHRSLRKAGAMGTGDRDTLFCLFGISHGGAVSPGSEPALLPTDNSPGEAVYSSDQSGGKAKGRSAGTRAASGSVVLGRPGDRWLDTIQFRRVERATRDGRAGYAVTYDISSHGKQVMFWSRVHIDFDGTAPAYRRKAIKLRKGRLWYPTRVTRRSLSGVHEAILTIERAYARQADGAIGAMEGFAVVAGLGGLKPSLRTTSSGAPRPITVRKPSRATAQQAAKGSTNKGKVGKSKAGKGKGKAGKAAGQIEGRWVSEAPPMSKRAAEYQTRFGRRGQAYRVNDVNFDGVANGVLLEAKGPGYANFVQKNGKFYDWFLRKGGKELLNQAERQVAAANGAPIHWHVAERAAAEAIRALLRSAKITGIRVFFTP